MTYAHWVVLFYKVYSKTLGIHLRWILSCVRSGKSIDGSALEGPFEGSISLTFLEGALKLSDGILRD